MSYGESKGDGRNGLVESRAGRVWALFGAGGEELPTAEPAPPAARCCCSVTSPWKLLPG